MQKIIITMYNKPRKVGRSKLGKDFKSQIEVLVFCSLASMMILLCEFSSYLPPTIRLYPSLTLPPPPVPKYRYPLQVFEVGFGGL